VLYLYMFMRSHLFLKGQKKPALKNDNDYQPCKPKISEYWPEHLPKLRRVFAVGKRNSEGGNESSVDDCSYCGG
jgi:hypothetical protein